MFDNLQIFGKQGLNLIRIAMFFGVFFSMNIPLFDQVVGQKGPAVALAQNKKLPNERLAVLMLRNRINMSREEVEYLTSVVRRIASKRLAHSYLIMTQENIEVLLPPNTKLEDCVSECQVETGRTLGARYIITGEILRFGSSLRLTLRMHDTKTGRLVSSEVAKGKEIEALEEPTEKAVLGLIQQIEALKQVETQNQVKESRSVTNQNPSQTSNSTSIDHSDLSEEVIIVGAQGRLNILGNQQRSEARSEAPDDNLVVDQEKTQVLRRRTQRKSRQALLRERAQQAEQEREARLSGRYQSPVKAKAQKDKTPPKNVIVDTEFEATQNPSDGKFRFNNTDFYLGFAKSTCLENNVDCQLDHDASLQLGWSYYGASRIPTNKWRGGFDIKYAHSSFSNSSMGFDAPDVSFTLNTFTLAYLFSYHISRLNFQVQVGWGFAFGNQSVTDFSSSESLMADLEFGSWNAINIGLSAGVQISSGLKLSVYNDRFDTLGDTEMCDFFSDQCSNEKLPAITQTGLRISWTPSY